MKTEEQQKLCKLIEIFYENQNGENFGQLINQLFRTPLLFPVVKGDKKGNFLLAEKDDVKFFSAFSDMEEAERKKIGDVDFVLYSIEEYADFVSKREEVQGLVINLLSEKNCIIKRDFFTNVVCPAFQEHHIMPGLRSEETGEYVPITRMPFSIGRDEQANLTIADNGINNIHALIVEHDDAYFVVDKDSLNGVYVNGQQVEKGGEQRIEFDDIIEFSDIEYAFVPMGIANKQTVTPSIYGNDKEMIANGMYVMQNHLLIQQFMKNEEQFVAAMEAQEQTDNFRRLFMIAMEATCDMKEKELQVTDEAVIKEQRRMMIGKGLTIFDRKDYGFTKEEEKRCEVYVAQFPEYLHIPELAKRMYFIKKEDGTKVVVKAQVTPGKVELMKVSEDEQMTECGEAPKTPKEELYRVIEVAMEA